MTNVISLQLNTELVKQRQLKKERLREVELLLNQIRKKPQLADIYPLFDFLFQKPHFTQATEDVFWWDLMWMNKFSTSAENYFSGRIYSGALTADVTDHKINGVTSDVLLFSLELSEQFTGPLELMSRNGYDDNEEFTLEKANMLLNTEYVKFMKFLGDYLESIDIRQAKHVLNYKGNPLKEFYLDLFKHSTVIGVPYHYYLEGDVCHISYQTPSTYNKLHLSFNYNLSAAHVIEYDGFKDGVFVGYN